jgi:DNA polymerase-1
LLQQRGHALTNTASATLLALGGDDPFIPLLLEYRDVVKQTGTYGEAWLRAAVHPLTQRIHADYLQLGSKAGRMSCMAPNMQNLPRSAAYRGCIHAAPGHCLVKADYSQIELRIAAVMAPEQTMLQAFRAGVDLHTLTASKLVRHAPDAVTAEQRQLAKAVNFGLLYGMGAKRLQEHAQTNYRVILTDAEARTHRQRFFQTYPGLQRWHRRTGSQTGIDRAGNPRPPLETRTMTGRRRLDVSNFTEALNTPIQGTGADGLKLAMARLFMQRDEVPEARLIAVVHDELVAECPIDQAPATAAWLQQHMQEAMADVVNHAVPIEVEVSIAADWAGTPLRQEKREPSV